MISIALEDSHDRTSIDRWQVAGFGRYGNVSIDEPATGSPLPEKFPISTWADCERMLEAATTAAVELRKLGRNPLLSSWKTFAARLDANVDELSALANSETALPVEPRLAKVELPRTSGQLRQAAAAVRSGSWAMPTIDTKLNIRSCYEPLGPICVFGPNNFPFAFQ